MNEQAIEVISDEIAQEAHRLCVDIQSMRGLSPFDYDMEEITARIKRREVRLTVLRNVLYHIIGGSETAERARKLDNAICDIQRSLRIV